MDVNQALSTNQVSRAKSLQTDIKNSSDKELMETCQDFEAMFIKQMLDSMKKTVNKSGLIKENMGEEVFDDMLYDEYAKNMAATSSFGIAKTMYKQLSATKYQ
ncbi:MAG: hypothetical protein B6229_05650 [Spirochaetaceae bacterium 4572_7]|nr:MAG: hypothetical protein B6229_05650 [Spirochaetaceae bacterium 4572_7]